MQTHLEPSRHSSKTKKALAHNRPHRNNRTQSKGSSRAKPIGRAVVAAKEKKGWGFLELFHDRISPAELEQLNQRRHPAGRSDYVLDRARLLAAIVFHFTLRMSGTLGAHLQILFGIKMTESSLSQRRQALPFEVFEELLRRVLRPITQMRDLSQAFYRRWRLLAIDGVGFSQPNNEAVGQRLRKGNNQHGLIGFAKLNCAVLLELIMHNPLAAKLGRHGESEWKLAQELLAQVPEKSLILGDRLYGCAAFVASVLKLSAQDIHCLLRVKLGTKVRRLKNLKDGSQLVEVQALEQGDTHRVASRVIVREIRATIKRAGSAPVNIRLWTTILDPDEAPAKELVKLYAARWEQELYFRELKSELNINDLLRSQTVETGAQEVAAMIIGSSLIAHERGKMKNSEVPQHRLSFIKIWETLEPLWLTLLLGADLLSEAQKQELCERFYQLAGRQRMARKRSRSCPREMRLPRQQFPRKKKNQQSLTGPVAIALTRHFYE